LIQRNAAGRGGADHRFAITSRMQGMDDAKLRKRILAGLGDRLPDEIVNVDVYDGRVVLSGAVKTWCDRDEIERMAWAAPDVRAVENCLTVHRAWRPG
jgi:osmotically-inducible protein OsmY